MSRPHAPSSLRPAFSLTEVLVVIGVVGLLAALLLTALASARRTAQMANAMSNMRQIGEWMKLYAGDNREHIVPSRFDYSSFPSPGQVRSDPASPTQGGQNQGTWSDILWTINGVGAFPQAVANLGYDYRFDSPDIALYDEIGGFPDNPFRSPAANGDQLDGGTGPRPFGNGAEEEGRPGFFAANDFFNARPDRAGAPATGRWYVTGQVRAPERSMYLVDCFAGEVIGGDLESVDGQQVGGDLDFDFSDPVAPTGTVDFRYSGVCLMLQLDGHVTQEAPWETLSDLETDRGLRIADPTAR
ncbi:MAG: prepilin-type N-terminal cleavage/methylation domain-containing protein [Planctomycetota bacterium]